MRHVQDLLVRHLRELDERAGRHISAREAAYRCKVPHQTMHRLLKPRPTRRRMMATRDVLERVATGLGIPLDDLLWAAICDADLAPSKRYETAPVPGSL